MLINIPQNKTFTDLGLDTFGQSPLSFIGSETNQKTKTIFEAGVPSTFIQDGDTIVRLNVIEGYLQSANFETGNAGWRIDADGNVEFEDGYFRGDISGASGKFSGSLEVGVNALHVDVNGNMWWGKDFNYDSATIKIKNDGTVNFTQGNFSGNLSAVSGTLDEITINSGGNIKLGQTAYNTGTGFWMGDASGTPKFSIGNGSTKYFTWDGTNLNIRGTLNADDITAGTLSGRVVQTNPGTTGGNVRLNTANTISFLYDNSEKGFMFVNSSGEMTLDADDIIHIGANNRVDIVYNDGGGSDSFKVVNDTATAIQVDDSRDLIVANDVYADNYFDYAEFFESTNDFKEGIPVGTTLVTEGDLVRPAKEGEIPFGAVSGSAAIILNGGSSDAGESWGKKYLIDDFGQKIYEERERWFIRKNGKMIKGWSDEKKSPKGAKKVMKKVQVLNPEYDESREFVHRKKRPEWNKVGLLGRVRIMKGQPVNPRWIKLKEISDTVDEWFIFPS